ncbi:MAG TPA: heliorhodopsin HeR [Bacillota bacterium]|nr:heliorhodopsin HeR [Bacillota bacterium]HPF42514.1 heliorhodopsin HeR [Bacillota bacterium]HPJ85988.1 heliorhodopsin HeR [Bacillota bacterium]
METSIISKLRRFNLLMGALHLIQGVAMVFLATSVIQTIAEFKPMITQFYLTYDPIQMTLVVTSKDLFLLPFGILTAVFLLLSAFAHFLVSVPFNKVYNRDLEKHINKFRWFEYALSSSVMIVLISTLFGIYDIASLVLIFVLNASMNMFGLLMEKINSQSNETKKVNWSPFVYGSLAGIAPWVVIFLYMSGNPSLDMVPWFVWAITITYFVMFNLFPLNMILQYKKVGKWSDYLYGEKTYIVLSLVAKTLLAWLVFFGAMQP